MHKVTSHKSLVLKVVLFFLFTYSLQLTAYSLFAQQAEDLEFTLDANSATIPLPKIFRPNIDLSGRGFHRHTSWPQGLSAAEALDTWEKDLGFGNIYRLQYNLWEIKQLAKDKDAQAKLLANYEDIIKRITDAGGIVILDIFSTPPGLGKALDKKSPPWNFKVFKELIKEQMKSLSCDKRYNVWYEVWSAPDLDDFFLGRKQEYLNIYRAVAESAKELTSETKIYIPVGGPSVSWWFQDFDANSIITPERSLIYELIKFCYRYHLPLDFITWHAYSTDPKVEKETTRYKKTAAKLVREWLSYFNFNKDTPLLVDEWNYDTSANILPERQEKSFIAASYILSRVKNMYEAGINYQLYFCLEDFQDNKEGVVRNVGVFSFDSEASGYKGAPKATYNVFRMLSGLGSNMFTAPSLKTNDEFVNTVATKTQDGLAIIVYNYIDPEISRNYLSRNIATLNGAERKALLNLITTDKLDKIMQRQLEISKLRATVKLKNLLKKAQELYDKAAKFKSEARKLNVSIKNIKGDYLYQRYAVDSSCAKNCAFTPAEKKELNLSGPYQEALNLSPYSVEMIILARKPEGAAEPQPPAGVKAENVIPAGAQASKEDAQSHN
ncbi:MAG: hypothetical protein PHC54_03980 [Candidatus Omnitrophica bacterium]|nr:hypothetical protein [Candidatus Omnitrophota bacterium]MDD5592457.1 hypothetical protein [Candidatus Omnitrophota bacterium]